MTEKGLLNEPSDSFGNHNHNNDNNINNNNNNKQQTTNNKQQTTNNKQQTTNNKQQKCSLCARTKATKHRLQGKDFSQG